MTFVTDQKAGIILALVDLTPQFAPGLCVFDSNGGRKRIYAVGGAVLTALDEILLDADFVATAGNGIYRVPSGLSQPVHVGRYFWAESIIDEKVLSLL